MRRGRRLCRRLQHPDHDIQLPLPSRLLLFQHLCTSLHRCKRPLGLSRRLTEKFHIVKQFSVPLHRYTGLRRRCSVGRGILSSMWRGFIRSFVAAVKISIWWKWRGNPESYNSWMFEILLWQDFLYAVDIFKCHGQSRPVNSDAFHQ